MSDLERRTDVVLHAGSPGSRISFRKTTRNSFGAVEERVAHHRCQRAAARQVHRAPDRAERPGDDRRVEALQRVAHAEREAGDEQAHPRLAEIAAEAVQQERPLQFLAHAAGDDHHDQEHPRG